MPKVNKIKKQKNIDSNIEKIFKEFIDDYLPEKYTDQVLEILPGFNANQIRVVKYRRRGNNKIIEALKTVSINNMNLTL